MVREGPRRKTEGKKLKKRMFPEKIMLPENLGLLWK